jgi:hypothetical protein
MTLHTRDSADTQGCDGISPAWLKEHDAQVAAKERGDIFQKLREHFKCRADSLEKKYPKGHDQRDGAQARIAEIEQTLMAFDAMEQLRQREQLK